MLGINSVGESNQVSESVFTSFDSIIIKLLLAFLTITGKLFKVLGKTELVNPIELGITIYKFGLNNS
jgi:hypothetical protein